LRLDHVQLAIPKGAEEICRAFWIGVLGFIELEKPEALKPRGGVWFSCGDLEIHLGVEAGFQPAKKAHPAFAVTDLEGLARKLKAAEHPVRWDENIAGRRRYFIDDPVGNRIEFLSDT